MYTVGAESLHVHSICILQCRLLVYHSGKQKIPPIARKNSLRHLPAQNKTDSSELQHPDVKTSINLPRPCSVSGEIEWQKCVIFNLERDCPINGQRVSHPPAYPVLLSALLLSEASLQLLLLLLTFPLVILASTKPLILGTSPLLIAPGRGVKIYVASTF
jgi:hypothetical protein